VKRNQQLTFSNAKLHELNNITKLNAERKRLKIHVRHLFNIPQCACINWSDRVQIWAIGKTNKLHIKQLTTGLQNVLRPLLWLSHEISFPHFSRNSEQNYPPRNSLHGQTAIL